MNAPFPEVVSASGRVWRVGFAPDMWAWPRWEYATDSGLFDGRWDDQAGQFRTLYVAGSMLGCFLELLARFRPSRAVREALEGIEDDDGTAAQFPVVPAGSVGHRWLENRLFGAAEITGEYLYVTHSRTLAALRVAFPLGRFGIATADADAALLKDARDRVLTRSIARWAYDLQPDGGGPVDGIRFGSRWGDEIPMWAVFERSRDGRRSHLLTPEGEPIRVSDSQPELAEAFRMHGLVWAD